jgi:hypothetical protein
LTSSTLRTNGLPSAAARSRTVRISRLPKGAATPARSRFGGLIKATRHRSCWSTAVSLPRGPGRTLAGSLNRTESPRHLPRARSGVDHIAFPVADRAELDTAAAHLDELSIAHEDTKDIASAASSGHASHRTGSLKANPLGVDTECAHAPSSDVVASRSAKAFRLPRGVGGVLSMCSRRNRALPSHLQRTLHQVQRRIGTRALRDVLEKRMRPRHTTIRRCGNAKHH